MPALSHIAGHPDNPWWGGSWWAMQGILILLKPTVGLFSILLSINCTFSHFVPVCVFAFLLTGRGRQSKFSFHHFCQCEWPTLWARWVSCLYHHIWDWVLKVILFIPFSIQEIKCVNWWKLLPTVETIAEKLDFTNLISRSISLVTGVFGFITDFVWSIFSLLLRWENGRTSKPWCNQRWVLHHGMYTMQLPMCLCLSLCVPVYFLRVNLGALVLPKPHFLLIFCTGVYVWYIKKKKNRLQ